jgi:hypothetical protein
LKGLMIASIFFMNPHPGREVVSAQPCRLSDSKCTAHANWPGNETSSNSKRLACLRASRRRPVGLEIGQLFKC